MTHEPDPLTHCEPATSIIASLGGLTIVSKITGTAVHTVQFWRYAKSKRGTGGVIPHWHWPKLLDAANELGVPLAVEDFFHKGERSEPASVTSVRTPDGTVLVRDPQSGRVVSGRSLDHAVSRLTRVRPAQTHKHAHVHEENPS